MRQAFRNDNELGWLKLTDSELDGEIIACALWRFNLDGEMPKIEESAPVQEVAGDVNVQGGKDEAEQKPSIWTAMAKSWKEFKDEFIGTKPHANLRICITHPKHQRRGAGSMLVEWGLCKADERGLMSVLQASEAGLRLYQKYRFTIVKKGSVDLRPFGVDTTGGAARYGEAAAA